MKKTFRLLGLALMATLMAASFTACGTDDDNEPTPVPGEESVTGWEIQPATETELD